MVRKSGLSAGHGRKWRWSLALQLSKAKVQIQPRVSKHTYHTGNRGSHWHSCWTSPMCKGEVRCKGKKVV
jgi:hypothetical protein